MGHSYYYFAASLPIIEWEGKLPMRCEEFLSAAKRLLAVKDSMLIEQLLKGNGHNISTDNAVAHSWIQFDRNFHNEQTIFRAHRAHKDPLKFIRGTNENDPSLREVIYEASKISDLLEAEKLLDRAAWQFLEKLCSGHYFDFEFLIIYGLKLKILQRHHDYRSSKGHDAFDQIQTMELPVG